MIKCKICGHENKFRLIEHIQKTHKMNIDEYKYQYGEVVSEEYKKKVSEKSIEKWKEDEYRQKTIESKLFSYTEEVRNKMSKKVKEFYDNGGKSWNEGLTKDTDERVANLSNLQPVQVRIGLMAAESFSRNPTAAFQTYLLQFCVNLEKKI